MRNTFSITPPENTWKGEEREEIKIILLKLKTEAKVEPEFGY
jgi:hypothetical protein